jgi:GTPase SAR1 family protein
MSDRRTILILSANPQGTNPLRLDKEVREIREVLKRSKYGDDLFHVEPIWAVRVQDIHQAMFDCQPKIVHFAGHGGGEKGLVFEDETGQVKLVSAEVLTGLFGLFANRLDCVLLNACYSEVQAKEISRRINYVIGMSQKIGDQAAIEFAVGFYMALGAGETFESCHKHGCIQINMQGISEHLIPQLLTKIITTNHYVERSSIEKKCYQNILEPGMLIRIKAPEKMGKSSLLNQILTHAKKQNYQTVCLDFQLLEDQTINDYSQFLRWLCKSISKQLKLIDQVDNYWNESTTLNERCSDYFQKHYLENPLVLALDNVDCLFEKKYQIVAADFFGMLRAWWGRARIETNSDWQKLRLIVVYSTEDLPKLKSSPFNVGKVVKLSDFDTSQTQALAQKYGLNLPSSQIEQLKKLVGGHPHLLQVAFECLKTDSSITLEKLLDKAATDEGIYSDHLQKLLLQLDKDKKLSEIFKVIVDSDSSITIKDKVQKYKLASMGLIVYDRNEVMPRYHLYRLYFREQLG